VQFRLFIAEEWYWLIGKHSLIMQWLYVFLLSPFALLQQLRTRVSHNPLIGEGFQINLGTYYQKYLQSQM